MFEGEDYEMVNTAVTLATRVIFSPTGQGGFAWCDNVTYSRLIHCPHMIALRIVDTKTRQLVKPNKDYPKRVV